MRAYRRFLAPSVLLVYAALFGCSEARESDVTQEEQQAIIASEPFTLSVQRALIVPWREHLATSELSLDLAGGAAPNEDTTELRLNGVVVLRVPRHAWLCAAKAQRCSALTWRGRATFDRALGRLHVTTWGHNPIDDVQNLEVALTIGAASAVENVPLARAGISFRYVRAEVDAISIQAAEATLGVSATEQLRAVTRAGAALRASWSSDAPDVASVSEDGLVTGLAPGMATIRASAAGQSASTQIEIVANVGFAIEVRPKLIKLAAPAAVQILVDTAPETEAVELSRFDGTTLPLSRAGRTTRFALSLTGAEALAHYQSDESARASAQSYLGTIRITGTGAPVAEQQLHVHVLTADPQPVTVDSVDADLQFSPHLVNILEGRLDSPDALQRVVSRFYGAFGDDYDFLAISWAASDHSAPYYLHVRNAVQGIGLEPLDNTRSIGAAGTQRLRGVIHFLDSFDLAHQVLSHEIGHCCINYLTATPLGLNSPHWPRSTTAFGVMGFGHPIGALAVTALDDGNFRVDRVAEFRDFNELELHLLGLASASEVPDHFIFADQTSELLPGIIQGPATVVRMADILSAYGPRVPAYPDTQTHFRLATIVVTRAGLLSAEEMAWFDAMAARGEGRTEIGEGMRPWFVSTRGRSTLSTSVP